VQGPNSIQREAAPTLHFTTLSSGKWPPVYAFIFDGIQFEGFELQDDFNVQMLHLF
jgi:hypothetical protein